MQINDAIIYATRKLNSSNSKRIDSEVLLCSVLKCNRIKLYAYPEQKLSDTDQKAFKKLVEKRSEGYPVAYLTKRNEFWKHTLLVN